MKKILTKFSDERAKEFCIETYIAELDDTKEKFVFKRNIFPEGYNHINRILQNNSVLSKAYSKVAVCPVQRVDKGLLKFDYINGVSLEKKYRESLRKNDRNQMQELLQQHKALILGDIENQCKFEPTAKYEMIFGRSQWGTDIDALKVSNFDATAGNIIYRGDEPVFIDYEWVFDFPLPIELAVYYNIRDAYQHIRGLEKFYPLKEAKAYLEINASEKLLEKAIENFFRYVYMGQMGQGFGLSKYMNEKGVKTVLDIQQTEENARRELYKCSQDLLEKTAVLELFEKNWREACQANAVSNQTIQRLQKEQSELQAKVAEQQQQIEIWRQAYETVVNSRTWRLAKKLKKIVRKK